MRFKTLLLAVLLIGVVLLLPSPSQAQGVPGGTKGKSVLSRILFVPDLCPDGRPPDSHLGCYAHTFDDAWWLRHYGYLFYPYYDNYSIARQRRLEILKEQRGCPWANEAAEAVSARQARGVPSIAVMTDLPPRREPAVPPRMAREWSRRKGSRPGASDSGGWVGGWSGGGGGYPGASGGSGHGSSGGAGGGSSSGGGSSADRGGGSGGGSGDTQAGRPR